MLMAFNCGECEVSFPTAQGVCNNQNAHVGARLRAERLQTMPAPCTAQSFRRRRGSIMRDDDLDGTSPERARAQLEEDGDADARVYVDPVSAEDTALLTPNADGHPGLPAGQTQNVPVREGSGPQTPTLH